MGYFFHACPPICGALRAASAALYGAPVWLCARAYAKPRGYAAMAAYAAHRRIFFTRRPQNKKAAYPLSRIAACNGVFRTAK